MAIDEVYEIQSCSKLEPQIIVESFTEPRSKDTEFTIIFSGDRRVKSRAPRGGFKGGFSSRYEHEMPGYAEMMSIINQD